MFLGVFFVVAGAYAVITYNHTHQNLLRSAYDAVSQYYTTFLQTPDINEEKKVSGILAYEANITRDNFTEVRVYFHKANGDDSGKGNSYTYYDANVTVLAETGDCCAVNFSAQKYGTDCAMGVIDYGRFRDSMTNEQYKKITTYLKSRPEKTELSGETRYELVCRSFYCYDYNVYPKNVEIVITNDKNKRYVDDLHVESFELEFNPPLDSSITEKDFYKSGKRYRNMIDTDFVLRKDKSRHLLDYIDGMGVELDDVSPEINTMPFTYIFFNRPTNKSKDKYIDTKYFIDFAREYNVLSECFVNILIASIIIFVFFFFVGIIVSRLSWKAICTEIEQENIRRDMTKAMAHDLKTPLFIISGYAESLRENINADKREYYADVIIDQTARMDELVHSMLDFSKFDTDNFVLNRESFSLSGLARKAVEKYPDSRLNFTCDDDCEINADRNLLTTVIDNLIDNAVKYGMQDTPIEVVISNGRLSVTNGIAKEIGKSQLEKVWEPYTKLDTARDSKGNGLGLAIAKRILDMHGFDYGAETDKNTIKFWISFS